MPKKDQSGPLSPERERLRAAFEEGGSVTHLGQVYTDPDDLPDTIDNPPVLAPVRLVHVDQIQAPAASAPKGEEKPS